MKSVVIVGATSMLGQEVHRHLAKEGIQIICAGRTEDSDIQIDLGSGKPPKFSRSQQADVLIHCAAAFDGDDSSGIRNNFRVNTAGAVDVLEIVRELGIQRILYAGSVSSDPSTESERHMSSYGLSKQEAEHILNWGMQKIGGSFCSLRLTQLWDTEGTCVRHQPWFGRIIAYAFRGLTLRMPPSNGSRNFLHVSDAARLFVKAAKTELAGIYPVTNSVDVDLHDLARAAYAVFNQGGEMVVDPRKQAFREICFPHDDRIYKILDVQPEIDILSGLELIRDAKTADRFGPLDVQ